MTWAGLHDVFSCLFYLDLNYMSRLRFCVLLFVLLGSELHGHVNMMCFLVCFVRI